MSTEQIAELIRAHIIETCPPEKLDLEFSDSSSLVATGILDSVGVFTLVAFLEERYAIDIDDIAEIISSQTATRIPNVDSSIVGVISVRGSIVTLVDVRTRLNQPPRGASKDSRIIVIRSRGTLIGFEVDKVLRPAKIDSAAIDPQPVVHPDEQSEFIRGVLRGPNALTIVLDLAKLVA